MPAYQPTRRSGRRKKKKTLNHPLGRRGPLTPALPCAGRDLPVLVPSRLALRRPRYLDDSSDPMPEQYEKAASLCIRCVIGGSSNFAGWDDTSFWSAVCADIIEPLQKNCKPWQRQVMPGEVSGGGW